MGGQQLELGKLYFKVVDFEQALTSLRAGLDEAKVRKNWSRCCDYLPLMLRIYAERLDFEAIESVRKELAEFRREPEFELTSATYYTLGIAAIYEGKLELSEESFACAHELANDLHERAQARFGLACVESQRGRREVAIEQLLRLREDLRASLLTDLKLATELLIAICYRSLGQTDQALLALGPLQELASKEQNLYMSLNVLFCYGTIYGQRGEIEKARNYFELVKSLIVTRDLKHLAVQVEKHLSELSRPIKSKPVIEFLGDHNVVTPEGKRVILKKQFILQALLKMLGEGAPLSKEEITQRLWKEEYNPLVHDNKIYVTIRRLRRLLEPDDRNPIYILNSPDGYVFNPAIEFRSQA